MCTNIVKLHIRDLTYRAQYGILLPRKGEKSVSEYNGYTKAMGQATRRYKEKNMERIVLDVRKGVKERYKAKAKERGMSLSAYICWLIENDTE